MSLHRIRRAAAGLGDTGDGGTGTVTFISSAENSDNSTSTLTVTMPTNADGDYLFVWIFTDSNSFSSPITPPSGWTTIDTQTSNVCGLYYKVASSEPASYNWGIADSAEISAIACSVRSATGVTSATVTDSNTTNSVTMPSDGMVLCFYAQESSSVTPVTPSGLTVFPTGGVATTNTRSIGYYGPASTGTVSGKTNTGFNAFQCDSIMVGVY